MKIIYLLLAVCIGNTTHAQSIDSLFVNLYTDSLKKGTYNYINVDGKLSNGHYVPLDSTKVRFSSSLGHFFGNNLWIDPTFDTGTAKITVALIANPKLTKTFCMSIKQLPDGPLKTTEEVMQTIKASTPTKKKARNKRNERL
jgi:hypothetical protein